MTRVWQKDTQLKQCTGQLTDHPCTHGPSISEVMHTFVHTYIPRATREQRDELPPEFQQRLEEFGDWLMLLFDTYFVSLLIYKCETNIYNTEVRRLGALPRSVFGVPHLLRLLKMLPEFLDPIGSPTEDVWRDGLNATGMYVELLCVYLDKVIDAMRVRRERGMEVGTHGDDWLTRLAMHE
eukprot:GDKI01042182.1.p2 GENE.GDKI01042182.1~~GDKI01042182.1.p2  ORF type:complete len:212 (-),score=64.62 GDKI01042182.1:23-565(-)